MQIRIGRTGGQSLRRRVPAIAFAAWYLVTPQVVRDHARCVVNSSAPIAQWHRSAAVADAESCRTLRDQAAAALNEEMTEPRVRVAYQKALAAGRCMASDDPLLKEEKAGGSSASGRRTSSP